MSNSLEQTSYTEVKRTTIDDIYGEGWWARNRDEVNRRFYWTFRYATRGERILPTNKSYTHIEVSEPVTWNRSKNPLIVVLEEKPQPSTLRDIYGVDEVTIPVGWEWTGEFRGPKYGETYSSIPAKYTNAETCSFDNPNYDPRLILRKRQPKVWFKAEEKERCPKKGQWFWSHHDHRWILADMDWQHDQYICATRHEEPDLTTQTVTQADIDRLQKVNS